MCTPPGQIRPSRNDQGAFPCASTTQPSTCRYYALLPPSAYKDSHRSANLSDCHTLSQGCHSTARSRCCTSANPASPLSASHSRHLLKSDPLLLHRRPLDNSQKCGVLLVLLHRHQKHLEDKCIQARYGPGEPVEAVSTRRIQLP